MCFLSDRVCSMPFSGRKITFPVSGLSKTQNKLDKNNFGTAKKPLRTEKQKLYKNVFKHLGKMQGECPHQNLIWFFCTKDRKKPSAQSSRFRTDPRRADPPITRSFQSRIWALPFCPESSDARRSTHKNAASEELLLSCCILSIASRQYCPLSDTADAFLCSIIMMHFPSNNAQVESNTFTFFSQYCTGKIRLRFKKNTLFPAPRKAQGFYDRFYRDFISNFTCLETSLRLIIISVFIFEKYISG